MLKSKFFISLFMIMVLIMPANVAFAGQNNNKVTSQQYSTWLWNTNQIVKSSDKIINFLSTNNVKILYLQIDYSLKDEVYRSFIKKASMKNISVHALDGGADWVSDSGASNQQYFFDWLAKFQGTSSANESFKGIHLDIEPYLNTDYNENMNGVLENYQALLLNALDNSEVLGLPLYIDIPFWFDEIEYDNNYGTGSLAEWIIKNVKNVVVMAYRDSAAGDDGIISSVSTELALGKQYDTAITIAVETQKSAEGNYVSFYEEGYNYMTNELEKVYANYKDNSSFGGFAIHNLTSWMSLGK